MIVSYILITTSQIKNDLREMIEQFALYKTGKKWQDIL